jgi:dihydroorotate dehydrogenase electron transfer subunit
VRSLAVTVLKKVQETPTQCTLILDWSPKATPGQFVMVWVPGVDEVPMGFSHLEPNAGITVQRMGEATEALCALEPGDRVGVRGPLGRGFILIEDRSCLLVGGGNGAAPLVPLAEGLVSNGCRVQATVGARTKEELLFEGRFGSVTGSPPALATDDGTEGYNGFVSDLADELMAELRPDYVYTCGPELMMRKVADSCWVNGMPFQASLERYMKCGVGLCDSCAFGSFQVCRDGPVFDGELLMDVPDFGAFRRGPSGVKEHYPGQGP